VHWRTGLALVLENDSSDEHTGCTVKLKRITTMLLGLALIGLMNPARAYICDNVQFFDECPTADPIFSKIVSDFKIRRNGVLINAATLSCTPPISTMPISAYTDELILLQALRAIYYMDLGRTNHLPWTSKALYDWLKDRIGGFDISSTASYDRYVGQLYLSSGDSANYFQIRAKDDTTRDYQRRWAGPVGIYTAITLMMHERRHADGSAFDHVRCCPAQDPANPTNACDQTYEETANLSPYGIQYWLEKNWVTGYINVGVGCITPTTDQTTAIQFMQEDGNAPVYPSSNFCTNTPPPLTSANNQPSCACAAGSTVGEPHIKTFDGLLYDFQAKGDFLLVTAGPSFIVQTRQDVFPPNSALATNQAVAIQMQSNRVAYFLTPTPHLVVDSKAVPLDDGKTLSLRDGVDVTRTNNTYVVKRQGGESVRIAERTYYVDLLDVTVSLGSGPGDPVRGLLGNATGTTTDDIVLRDGTVLPQPVSFQDLYGRYAESYRISPRESLFGEGREIAPGVPDRPFYANNLPKELYDPARTACKTAGVSVESLLDACTMDVAYLGTAAAVAFTTITPPVAVMQPGYDPSVQPTPSGHSLWFWLLVLLAVVVALILWLRLRSH
jgi:von Willebrand factor type D domain